LERSAVTVVIVHRDESARCLRSIEAFRAQDVAVEIIVVDNGSELAHLRPLRASGATILEVGYNAGFGPGANAGLRYWLAAGHGPWVLVAPHDARPRPGCLRRLIEEVEGYGGVGLASAEFGPDFELVPALDRVIGAYYRPASRGDGWQAVDYPHGTLLLARREALLDVGLFDERYFAYCEEADLAIRARRRGWAVGLVWGAVVDNDRLPDRRVADYLQLRNTLLLVRSHFGRWPATVRATYALGRVVARAARADSRAQGTSVPEARALLDFVRGRFGPPPPQLFAPSSPRSRRRGSPGTIAAGRRVVRAYWR